MNFLYAKKHHGEFILRFDDTDVERSKEEFAQAIEVDLAWLGIVPDAVLRQSGRFALYRAAAKRLRDAGRLYPCYETAGELDRKRKRQQARGLPPVYDRAALALSGPERARLEAEGRRPHWRFKLDHEIVRWTDLVRGDSHIDCASLSDPVLLREDGTYLYTLPSVVDDIEQKITHDHPGRRPCDQYGGANSAFRGFGRAGQAPCFRASQPFVFGERRRRSRNVPARCRSAHCAIPGIESLAVAAAAVLIGSSVALHPVASLDELATCSISPSLPHALTRIRSGRTRRAVGPHAAWLEL